MWLGSATLFDRLVMRPADRPQVVFKKRVVLIVAIMTIVTYGGAYFLLAAGGTDSEMLKYLGIPAIVSSAVCLCQLIYEKTLRGWVIEAMLYGAGISCILTDQIYAATQGERIWPAFIIYIDICLLCNLRPRVTKILITSVFLWLFVLAFEARYRFGLLDFSLLPTQEFRHAKYECNSLPCTKEARYIGIDLFFQLFVISTVFFFTRNFATKLYREHDSMNEVIYATERIAASLSRFDLESAEMIIEGSHLPPPLLSAFQDILANLHSYRRYLPQCCLVNDECLIDEDNNAMSSQKDATMMSSTTRDVIDRRRCSFIVANLWSTHRQVVEDPIGFQSRFSQYVETLLAVVSSHSGVVGVTHGDHIHASFNAGKRCGTYAKSAVDSAVQLFTTMKSKGIRSNIGLSCGAAYCGSLGCTELMSFSMIGQSPITASKIERFGRSKAYPIVCCSTVYAEVSYAFTMQVILARVVMSAAEGAFEVLYDISTETPQVTTASNGEWMYQLSENHWEIYNKAARCYILDQTDEALRLLNIRKPTSKQPESVKVVEAQLKQFILLEETYPTILL